MVSKRDRILRLELFLKSLGIQVNINRNKARGNKGFFKVKDGSFRIDISKGLCDDAIIRTLTHEFAHYVHYLYDKKLSSLDFIFESIDDEVLAELLNLTVDQIPKSSIEPLFIQKTSLEKEIKELKLYLSTKYDDFEKDFSKKLEASIRRTNLKYLLNHDRVKVYEGFIVKFYSIEDLDDSDLSLYIKFKSKLRKLKSVRTKISRLNKYYNAPTELFARSFECYIFSKKTFKENAPILFKLYEEALMQDKVPLLSKFVKEFCLE